MSKDQELLDVIKAFGPISAERAANRLGIEKKTAVSRIQRLRQSGEVFNTNELTQATYAATKPGDEVLVPPNRVNVMEQPNYTCPELSDEPARIGASAAMEVPSRIGDWRMYRDGRRERCQ